MSVVGGADIGGGSAYAQHEYSFWFNRFRSMLPVGGSLPLIDLGRIVGSVQEQQVAALPSLLKAMPLSECATGNSAAGVPLPKLSRSAVSNRRRMLL